MPSSSSNSSQTHKRQSSSETIRPSSKQSRYSAKSIWKGANTLMKGGTASSSSTPHSSSVSSLCSDADLDTDTTSSYSANARPGHKRSLSTSYAIEDSQQSQRSSQHARTERGSGLQRTASLSLVNVHATSANKYGRPFDSTKEGSKENSRDYETQQQHGSSQLFKGKGREETPPSPRPALRVVNANAQPDEFEDTEENPFVPPSPRHSVRSSPTTSGYVQDPNAQVISPSSIVGDASTWSSPVLTASYSSRVTVAPVRAMGGNSNTGPTASRTSGEIGEYVTYNGMTIPRVSLRIKPRETHAAFWDAEDGQELSVKGRLELIDMLHDTYYHHAQIQIRSFVAPAIRGIEHPEEPEFVIRYIEPTRGYGSDPNGGMNIAAIEAAGAVAREWERNRNQGQPSVRSMLEDMDTDTDIDDSESSCESKLQMKTSEWAELSGLPVPVWSKYFNIPIPAKLFETRESRVFRLEARVSFLSKIRNGRNQELQAPTVHVSVSHLLSARELGIRKSKPSRNPFDTA